MEQIERCVVFEVDGKAFEAHVDQAQIREEHSIYRIAGRGDPRLQELLKYQLRLSGRTACGWKFDRSGGRASGDYNTGMGNTLIMLAAVWSALGNRGFSWDVLADGDNALVFVSADHYDLVRADFYDRVLFESGHECTLEAPAITLEDVRFGQSAPVFLGHGLGWTMCRDPRKVLSTCFSSYRWLGEEKGGLRWCSGVARCELSLAVGLPIVQQVFVNVLNRYGHLSRLSDEAYRDYVVIGAKLDCDQSVARLPTPECRRSFEKAFGFSPRDQALLESTLDPVLGHASLCEEYGTVRDLWTVRPGILEDWFEIPNGS